MSSIASRYSSDRSTCRAVEGASSRKQVNRPVSCTSEGSQIPETSTLATTSSTMSSGKSGRTAASSEVQSNRGYRAVHSSSPSALAWFVRGVTGASFTSTQNRLTVLTPTFVTRIDTPTPTIGPRPMDCWRTRESRPSRSSFAASDTRADCVASIRNRMSLSSIGSDE